MSDGYEGTHGGKGDGKVRKHHRRSTRTRSRQEKISRPKLSMLNVGVLSIFTQITFNTSHVKRGKEKSNTQCVFGFSCFRCATLETKW